MVRELGCVEMSWTCITIYAAQILYPEQMGTVAGEARFQASSSWGHNECHSDSQDNNLNPMLGVVQNFFSRPGGLHT